MLLLGFTLLGGVLLLTALAPAPLSFAAPQGTAPSTPPPAPQAAAPAQRPGISVVTNLVLVPVTVKDASGALVGDVRQDEFRVFEDGAEQRISLFSVDAAPLSVVLLVDGGMKLKTAEQLQKSLVAMAGGVSASDEVGLARFDAFFAPILDFTSDSDRLVTELKRVDLSSSEAGIGTAVSTSGSPINVQSIPGTPTAAPQPIRMTSRKHIDDAVYAAAQLLATRDRMRRKVILLVSNGVNAKTNTHTYDETLRMLLSSDVAVYSVGVDIPLVARKLSVLSRYAHSTGGDIYYANDQAELSRLYAQIGEQARHEYTLGYIPAAQSKRDYHSIEVRIRRPGLTLIARDGYYPIPRP
jgi:VWFA-related protein